MVLLVVVVVERRFESVSRNLIVKPYYGVVLKYVLHVSVEYYFYSGQQEKALISPFSVNPF